MGRKEYNKMISSVVNLGTLILGAAAGAYTGAVEDANLETLEEAYHLLDVLFVVVIFYLIIQSAAKFLEWWVFGPTVSDGKSP